MKKLTILIIVFFLSVSIPMAYLLLQTYHRLKQEEADELRYFADTLFNEMEEELSYVVIREERRAIDEYYDNNMAPPGQALSASGTSLPQTSGFPQASYILCYLQNNPDGSFQTPFSGAGKLSQTEKEKLLLQMKSVNETLNLKWAKATAGDESRKISIPVKEEKIDTSRYAEKYLRLSRFRKQKDRLRHKKSRSEYVSLDQILNIAKLDRKIALERSLQEKKQKSERKTLNDLINERMGKSGSREKSTKPGVNESNAAGGGIPSVSDRAMLLVQVDPVQSVFVDDSYVFIYRGILLNNQIYRQGVVIKIQEFLNHLINTYFVEQPMAAFTNLRLNVTDKTGKVASVQKGAHVQKANFAMSHNFSPPFSFLSANITCEHIPRSAARRTLDIMMVVLVSVLLMGLFAIYKSVRTVVDLSERRSGFVSSVTHELKTPLTTIRMYIEMLELGIARDHEREQEYLRILGSESSRLSRLINNVLEFSKLEKKQRRFDLREGTFEDVIDETRDVLDQKLQKEGFSLQVKMEHPVLFRYDREVMIQVMINLIENSLKFGRGAAIKEIIIRVWSEGKYMNISVSDTGPGIPRHALKKVFDNFYRVDNDLSRKTGGTGIGLALVKNYITSMGGSVAASNNAGSGCTVTIKLPL